MPKESLSVYLTAVDGISPVFASITDKTRALDKESQELAQTYEALQKANKGLITQKTELQKKLQEVNEEVKEARKQFKELGDEASSDAFEKAQQKQQALRNQITATTKSLQENQKIYKENIETIRKGGTEEGNGLNKLVSGLFAGQIGQMFSSSIGGVFEARLTSAMGTPQASLVSDMISSAISGAAAGTLLPLPGGAIAGAALGAGAGLVSGFISGETKIFEAKDDAFKDYYGGLYNDVKERSGEMVESGSSIAGGREQTRLALAQRFGSESGAIDYLADVEALAAKTNYGYDEIVGYTKLLLNSYKAKTEVREDGTKETDVLDVLMALSDATAGLDLSSGDVNMMISGLSRMRTTGKATQEYLNYFRERGVDTDQALADALTDSSGKMVDKSSIADMVREGGISGEFAAQAILDYIQETFGGLSDTLAGTYDAMVDNLGDMEASLQAAGGDAHNDLRREGINEQMLAYEGELGDAIKEINAVMGENQARRENLQDQYMREALDAVLNGNQGSVFTAEESAKLAELSAEYAQLKARYDESGGTDAEAGAKLQSLYEQTQALGQAYFENSDFVQMLNDTELDEIEAIREATAGLNGATQAAYILSQELSKGYAAAPKTNLGGWELQADGSYKPPSSSLIPFPSFTMNQVKASMTQYGASGAGSHAFGLNRVPYDDYPALLHQGERVLTAAEARAQDAAGSGPSAAQVTITGNYFTGTPEEMAEQLAEIIVRRLEQAATAAAPK